MNTNEGSSTMKTLWITKISTPILRLLIKTAIFVKQHKDEVSFIKFLFKQSFYKITFFQNKTIIAVFEYHTLKSVRVFFYFPITITFVSSSPKIKIIETQLFLSILRHLYIYILREKSISVNISKQIPIISHSSIFFLESSRARNKCYYISRKSGTLWSS